MNFVKLSLTEHLDEIKKRLKIIIFFFVIFFGISYYIRDTLLGFFIAPLQDLNSSYKMTFFALQEGFLLYVKISMLVALIASAPIIFQQIYKFLALGLYKKEKKILCNYMIVFCIFFLCGISLSYFVVIPLAWEFFISYTSENLALQPRLKDYIDLSIMMMIIFGLLFQVPLIFMLLFSLNLISANTLSSKRKIFIIIAFLTAAFLTPPDIISQIILASCMIVLYELSILYMRFRSLSKLK